MRDDFGRFALGRGISGMTLDDYGKKNGRYLNYIEPFVIEERQMNVTNLSIYSRLMMDRIVFIGSDINDEVANIVTAQLLWLEQQSQSEIQIMISSPGGSVMGGYSIIDCMDFITPEISTTVVGCAASMAAVIASNGTRGKRHILPHARFMIHQPRMGMSGSYVASDLTIEAEEVNKLKKELYETLSKNSNHTFEEIERMSDRDRWFTATEAVEHGFIDDIIYKK